ncbi:MAG: hypothetical protein OEX19_06410 [Gammaproteobacteria bacterium]|nr:hypothetical protein [Gammaproteobacteria bacterium]
MTQFITIVFIVYVLVVGGSLLWVLFTKDRSLKKVKHTQKLLANTLFYGSVVLLTILVIMSE